MSIIIGADIVPTESNKDRFAKGDLKSLLGEDLYSIIRDADFSIFNLEVPLIDTLSPINKQGPALAAPEASISGLSDLNICLLTLANNHILDQGVSGLQSTMNLLGRSKIDYIGAGKNLSEASDTYRFAFYDKTVGVYACAEHEFSIASESSPGANPFDPLWSFDHVAELKKTSDFVIVLYHGGKEHYRYPSPDLQKVCRRFIDKGADLVVCQHSHCIGCEEHYENGTIVYGQGNFLFDYEESELWNTSLLISVDKTLGISYIPLVRQGNGVRIATEESESIMRGFRSRSDEIKHDGFVKENYNRFAEGFSSYYLRAMSGKKGIVFRLINKLSGGKYYKNSILKQYGKKEQIRLLNYFECEAHRELCIQALKNNIK